MEEEVGEGRADEGGERGREGEGEAVVSQVECVQCWGRREGEEERMEKKCVSAFVNSLSKSILFSLSLLTGGQHEEQGATQPIPPSLPPPSLLTWQ